MTKQIKQKQINEEITVKKRKIKKKKVVRVKVCLPIGSGASYRHWLCLASTVSAFLFTVKWGNDVLPPIPLPASL